MTELPMPDSVASASTCQNAVVSPIAAIDSDINSAPPSRNGLAPCRSTRKAHRSLQNGGSAGHQHDRHTEFGEADLEAVLPGREHRRQAQDAEMRQEVPVADQDIDTGGAAQRHVRASRANGLSD